MQKELLQKKNETLHIIAYLADQVRQIDSQLNGKTNDNEKKTQNQHNGVEYNGRERDS